MFYNAHFLDDLLKCQICFQKFNDPRLLPCGATICNRCVEHWQDADNNIVKCQKCRISHAIPDGGLPSNQALAAICNVKPFNIEASQITSELSHVHSQLESKAIDLDDCLKIGETTIRNKCDEVRNDVQLAIELAEFQICEFGKTIMNEILAYEEKCKQNLVQVRSDVTVLDIFNEAKKFVANTSLNLEYLNENELLAVLSESRKLLKKVERLDRHITSAICDNKRMEFQKSTTSLELGSIEIYSKKRFFNNSTNVYIKELNQHLNDMCFDCKPSFINLDQCRLFVAYTNSDSFVILCIINLITGELKKEITEFKSISLETAALNNRLFVLMCSYVDNPNLVIASFDFRLAPKDEDEYLNTSNLSLIDGNAFKKTLIFLDNERFNLSVIPEDLTRDYLFSCNLKNVATSLLNFGKSTLVMCKREGWYFEDDDFQVNFEVEYSEQSSKCFKFDEKTFVVHDTVLQTVNFYGLDMERFQEVDHVSIKHLPLSVRFIGTSNKMLYFFDQETKKIYYF
jgi:hypothetical protein